MSDLSDGAIAAIRQKLRAYGIPEAAFIDDHVGNLAYFLNVMMRAVQKIKDTPADAVGAEDAITKAITDLEFIQNTMETSKADFIARGLITEEYCG
jgi:hypothetical protein